MKDKILAVLVGILLLCGLVGLHNDWTLYIMVIPFGWLLLGVALDWLINGKGSGRDCTYNAIACALILVNMATILVHRDTAFIVGRLLCSFGCVIVIINNTKAVSPTAPVHPKNL